MKLRKTAAALAAGALTVLTATGAYGDIVYNDIDGNDVLDPDVVDTTHEVMNLTLGGSPGTTELRIQIKNQPDHPQCNLPGEPHKLTLSATYDAAIATVAFPDGLTFFDCDDVLDVIVTPVSVGATTVAFAYVADVPTSQGHERVFSVAEADFDVVVAAAGDGEGEVCDADPAAPAWAAALLKGNNVKAPGKVLGSYVSAVARHMGPRATFDGIEKSDHEDYEDAVYDFMTDDDGMNLSLTKGPRDPDVVKPGWECTPVTPAIS